MKADVLYQLAAFGLADSNAKVRSPVKIDQLVEFLKAFSNLSCLPDFRGMEHFEGTLMPIITPLSHFFTRITLFSYQVEN